MAQILLAQLKVLESTTETWKIDCQKASSWQQNSLDLQPTTLSDKSKFNVHYGHSIEVDIWDIHTFLAEASAIVNCSAGFNRLRFTIHAYTVYSFDEENRWRTAWTIWR